MKRYKKFIYLIFLGLLIAFISFKAGPDSFSNLSFRDGISRLVRTGTEDYIPVIPQDYPRNIQGYILNPLQEINRFSNEVTHIALENIEEVREISESVSPTFEDIRFMIGLDIQANIVDYNTPDMQSLRTSPYEAATTIVDQLKLGGKKAFSSEFGGEYFLRQFYEKYLSKDNAKITFFPDNNGQGVVALKVSETFLKMNETLKIYFIPKNNGIYGAHTNDLAFDDVMLYLKYDINLPQDRQLFTDLVNELAIMDKEGDIYALEVVKEGDEYKLDYKRDQGKIVANTDEALSRRFIILEDGPRVQGLDPAHMSNTMIRALLDSEAVITEGQAFAEIAGWKRPVFFAFMIKGRAAQAIHGVSKKRKVNVFVGPIPGSFHYEDVPMQLVRYYSDPINDQQFGVAKMSTREYILAIFSKQWQDLVTQYGLEGAVEYVNKQREATGKTFYEVVIQSEPQVDIQPGVSLVGDIAVKIAERMSLSALHQEKLWNIAQGNLAGDLESDQINKLSNTPNEENLPKYATFEVTLLSRILIIARIIEAHSGMDAEQILTKVRGSGRGTQYSRVIDAIREGDKIADEIMALLP